MRLDSMVRLIEAADVGSFRQLAIHYFDLAGYTTVEIKDGPHDGGSDLALFRQGQNPEPIAVQLSTQRKGWRSKARSDAVRARDVLGSRVFVYVTSRRIPAEEAQQVIDDLWSNHAIAGRFVDSQALASTFYKERRTNDVLEALGVLDAASAEGDRGTPANLKEDLAYAYAFFGTDADGFREAVIDRTLAAYVTHSEKAVTRDIAIRSVGKVLKLSQGRERIIASRIDRMLQTGQLCQVDDYLQVPEDIVEAHKSARIVRGRQWRKLQDEVTDELVEVGLAGKDLERAADTVSDAAGALMLAAATSASAALTSREEVGPARRQIRAELSRLSADFARIGLSGDQAQSLVTKLTKLISESDIGQTLLAGHLFLSLISMEPSDLLKALGGHDRLEIFLDASVAIPMLASVLYEPHKERSFQMTHYAFEQARRYGAELSLPEDYLEESASHLLDAYDHYRPLLDEDNDLRFSRNAFVAHYVALRAEGKYDKSFTDYAASFGLRPSEGNERSFRVERDWIMDRMRTLFSRYGVKVVHARTVPTQAMRSAQEAISFTSKELGLERSSRLLKHDARAVADISSRAAAGDHAVMFCTWDRLHLRLRTAGGAVEWHAVDPSMLGDLFALLSDEEGAPIGGAVEVALELGEEEATRGAEVWDELIAIEEGKFYDAELLRRAQDFKAAYVDKCREGEMSEPLGAAWERWKQTGNLET
jgi:tetratricopeptide (TPR) repeat protein